MKQKTIIMAWGTTLSTIFFLCGMDRMLSILPIAIGLGGCVALKSIERLRKKLERNHNEDQKF